MIVCSPQRAEAQLLHVEAGALLRIEAGALLNIYFERCQVASQRPILLRRMLPSVWHGCGRQDFILSASEAAGLNFARADDVKVSHHVAAVQPNAAARQHPVIFAANSILTFLTQQISSDRCSSSR